MKGYRPHFLSFEILTAKTESDGERVPNHDHVSYSYCRHLLNCLKGGAFRKIFSASPVRVAAAAAAPEEVVVAVVVRCVCRIP